jgi:DNA invertase Pin-like site-specific DNA recombinase
MNKAALYARYSTDRQRETSIDDQLRICRQRANDLGLTVVAEFRDEATSGSTRILDRPGSRALMGATFDVLVVESLDRLSRDMIDQETTIRRLEHRGVRLIGVSDGYDSESSSRKLQRGVRSVISEVYLDDLRYRTHRGLSGQVSRGLFAGGLPFGYRTVAVEGGHILEIDEPRAAIVRRIFAAFTAGTSITRIAHDLNRDRLPSPRGSTWAVSAIYGSPNKGTGVLNNEIYRGRYTWNRSQWVKDPDTGKRRRIERPESEWQSEDRPELRIIDDATWLATRDRMNTPARLNGSQRGKRPTTLFGGLLVCGHCGGAVVSINARAYGCAARKDRGPTVCTGVMARRDRVDARLLAEIRAILLEPQSIRDLVQLVEAAAKQLADPAAAARQSKRLRELDGEIGRIIDAIASVGLSSALQARLKLLEDERAELEQRSVQTQAVRVPTATEIRRVFREVVIDLQSALSGDIHRARQLLLGLIGRVAVTQYQGDTHLTFDEPHAALAAASGLSLGLVAGAGFETKRRRITL